ESIAITNTTNPAPTISAAGSDTEICEETSLSLSTGIFDQYAWSNGSSEQSIEVETDGIYTVQVTDANGCIGTAQIEITDCDLFGIPNAFTPNGDGLNDEFGVEFQGDVEIVDFQIFNRWGEVVHNNIGYWDGTFNGENQPMEVYIYKVLIRIPGQEDELITGDVHLIR
ncbi:MAG: gliding motility-associated C-terminal domain-containing protein, partial [Bacteroidota bacterium]